LPDDALVATPEAPGRSEPASSPRRTCCEPSVRAVEAGWTLTSDHPKTPPGSSATALAVEANEPSRRTGITVAAGIRHSWW